MLPFAYSTLQYPTHIFHTSIHRFLKHIFQLSLTGVIIRFGTGLLVCRELFGYGRVEKKQGDGFVLRVEFENGFSGNERVMSDIRFRDYLKLK